MTSVLVIGAIRVDARNSELRHGFHLGDCLVRPDRCAIEGPSGTQHLEPKLMEVLLYLALKPGEVVRRQLLIDEVWRTVVNDEVLSRAISLLRSHLGDDPKSPRYILTVPKIGYRLILEPIVVLKPSSSPGRPDAVESPESSLPARTRLLLRHATGIWR